MALFPKKSKFKKSTLQKAERKKYKKPVSILHKNKRSIKAKRRQTTIRKLAKLVSPKQSLRENPGFSKFTLIAATSFITLGTIYVIFFTNLFQVKKIQIFEGEQETTNVQVRKLIEPLRGKNILFIDNDAISRTLRNEIENISAISIKKLPPKTIKITYAKFQNVANLINVNTKKNSERTKQIINEVGVITQKGKSNLDLPNISIQRNGEFELSDQAISQSKLNYILEAIQMFTEKFDIQVFEAAYLLEAREVHLVTNQGFNVWIDMEQDLEKQLNKLKNAIPKIDIYKDPLEYIDLRIESANGDKIIFKRK